MIFFLVWAKLLLMWQTSSPTLKVKWSVTYINVYKFSSPCPHFGSFYHNDLVNLTFFCLFIVHTMTDFCSTQFSSMYKIVCDKLELSFFCHQLVSIDKYIKWQYQALLVDMHTLLLKPKIEYCLFVVNEPTHQISLLKSKYFYITLYLYQ
jgi:hypothetical protein